MIWRLSYRTFSAVSALWSWTTRRFTAAGTLALGSVVLAGALGVDTNQTLAYQVFTLLCALLAAAMLATLLLRPRFLVARSLPRMVTAGQSFDYRVTVRNLGARAADGLALIEDLSDPRPSFAEFRASLRFPTYRGWWRLAMRNQLAHIGEIALPALGPGGEVELRVRGLAYRRGTLRLVGSTVARADPLGLFRSLAQTEHADKMIVLPRRYGIPPLTLPGARKYQQGGVTLAISVGESEEFMSLRDYRPGDPLQRIHWKSFARAGKPVVKEYQDEFFERHALVLDTFLARNGASLARDRAASAREFAAFEEAVSVAASFACTLDTQECLLDLMFVGASGQPKEPGSAARPQSEPSCYCFTAGRGQLPSGGLIEILAGVRATRDQPFENLRDAVLERRAALSGCFLVLLSWDAPRRELVDALRRSGLPLVVMLVSATPIDSPPPWLHVLVPGRIQEGLARL